MGSIHQQAEIANQSIIKKTYFEHVFKSFKHQPNVLINIHCHMLQPYMFCTYGEFFSLVLSM